MPTPSAIDPKCGAAASAAPGMGHGHATTNPAVK
jgi:hypothetical protein